MIYAFGQYELDTRVYELRQSGVVRPVEPQVFDVLAYLVQNRDRVVSKGELLEKLWPDRFVSETTLTSRLKEARKAVGDTGEKQAVIRTQRGRGYRFVAEIVERGEPEIAEGAPSADARGAARSELPLDGGTMEITIAGPSDRSGFVGRKAELDRLGDILGRAASGTRQIAFVTGDAGAGKTTLIDTFLAGLPSEKPVLVARGQCVEYRGSAEPYMPLLDAFARLCGGSHRDRLIPLLKSVAPSWIVQMPSVASDAELDAIRARSGASGERMLRELGLMLDRLTAETPLVLVLEDLHWSDYATLDAIDLLAKQTEPARLMIVGTWRPSDVKAARHPVYALSQELRVRGRCDVIQLGSLGVEELDAYLEARFGDASFHATLAPILHSRTAGNALFVRNLVDSWIERDLIRRDGDTWSLAAEPKVLGRDVPDSLGHLIENQVSELDPEEQQILATASVVGRTFRVALIAATLPAADDDVELICERLVRESNIIRADGAEPWGDGTLTSRFSFVHDLHVDVLYLRTPAARRARIHGQVGLALERAWNGREKQHAPELALHFQRAHDLARGPKYLQLASEQAIERNAYREAVDLLSAALEMLVSAPESPERDAMELQVRCRLAPSLVATRGWADSGAEENYLRARALAEELGDATALLQTLYGLANMYEYRGEYDLAERIAKERIVLDTCGTNAQTLESHELLTCSLLHQGRYGESVRHGEVALAAFAGRSASDLEPEMLVLVVQSYGWMSGSLHFAGRADEALEHGRRALTLAEESGNQLAAASANVQAAFVRYYRREPDSCGRLATIGEEIGREFRFPFHVACARILRGWADAGSRDTTESIREIRAGIRTSEAIGARMDLPLFHAILAEVFIGKGDPVQALRTLDAGLSIVSRGRTFFYVPELYRLRAGVLLALGAGHRDEAVEVLQRALGLAREQECPLFALRIACDLARLDAERWKETLRTIVNEFQQGLDTVDVNEAREILGS